jgi:acetyl-CoA/propionyl-CoA carboxylase biotin carboxyl carrier protein
MYDPMVAKLIVWDADREAATARMLRALDEYEIGGLTTLIPFHKALLSSKQWRNAETCRDLVEDAKWLKSLAPEAAAPAPAAEEAEEEKVERDYTVEVDSRRFSVKVIGPPPAGGVVAAGANSVGGRAAPRRDRGGGAAASDGSLVSPLQGTVLRVNVEKGQEVEAGAVICVIEAMKMENEITAPVAGKVEELNVKEGASVSAGDALAKIG